MRRSSRHTGIKSITTIAVTVLHQLTLIVDCFVGRALQLGIPWFWEGTGGSGGCCCSRGCGCWAWRARLQLNFLWDVAEMSRLLLLRQSREYWGFPKDCEVEEAGSLLLPDFWWREYNHLEFLCQGGSRMLARSKKSRVVFSSWRAKFFKIDGQTRIRICWILFIVHCSADLIQENCY